MTSTTNKVQSRQQSATNPTGQQKKDFSKGINTDASQEKNADAQFDIDVQPDLYAVLGLKQTASQQEVDLAFKKKASQCYPDKVSGDKVEASRKFNEATYAYSILSDPARRDDYDQINHFQFDKSHALRIFDQFFKEHGILSEEQEFFKKYYPERVPTFYEILGVPRRASQQQIQQAYKKKAFQLHPSNKSGDSNLQQKFVQLSQAFYCLKDRTRRKVYDNLEFQEVPAFQAHAQFNSTFIQDEELPNRDQQLGRLVKKQSIKDEAILKSPSKTYGHRQAVNDNEFSQQVRREVVSTKGVDGITTRTKTYKSQVINGKTKNYLIEQTIHPNGAKSIKQSQLGEYGPINISVRQQAPPPKKNKPILVD